jgi:aspartyl protease family protein
LALRFLGFAVAIVALAVMVPKLAPGVLGALMEGRGAVATLPSSPAAAAREAPASPRETLDSRRMILDADRLGHFLVAASVNGRDIEAMVDTGATTVALNAESARRLGIVPARSAFTAPISTANGIVAAAPVTLDEVRVGGIRLRNVAAVVVPDGLLQVNLLGMSFLGRLSKFELSGPQLVLYE